MTPAHYLPVSDNVGAIVGVTVQHKHQEGNEKHDRAHTVHPGNAVLQNICHLRLATEVHIHSGSTHQSQVEVGAQTTIRPCTSNP